MTQIEMVREHLKHYPITQKEAYELYGSLRLSHIIYMLRKEGMAIETDMVQGKNRFGHNVNYARYHLDLMKDV
jgi:hypothetical protein